MVVQLVLEPPTLREGLRRLGFEGRNVMECGQVQVYLFRADCGVVYPALNEDGLPVVREARLPQDDLLDLALKAKTPEQLVAAVVGRRTGKARRR